MVYEYFAQGLALLRRHGNCPVGMLRQFEAYEGRSFVPSHLENQVRMLVARILDETPVSVNEAKENSNEAEEKTVMGDQVKLVGAVSGSFWGGVFAGKEMLPQEVWKLHERAVGLHKEQANLHPLMVQAARDGKRAEARRLAAEIMDRIIPELDGIYDAAREWSKSGKLPAATRTDDIVRQTVDKMRRIEYCKQRTSRIRSWLKAGEREMKVDGEKQAVKLEFADRRSLEKELLERQLEEKGLREELGIDD